MTVEETKRICDLMWQMDFNNGDIEKVRKALEKQIPKKVIVKDCSENIWDGSIEGRDLRIVDVNWRASYYCSFCGNLLFECDDEMFEEWSEETNFCNCCGQSLDWSEE